MVLVSVIAFAVLKMLNNLVLMQKSLQITAEVSKITWSDQCDLTETLDSFVKILLVLEIKKVAIFIKARVFLNA